MNGFILGEKSKQSQTFLASGERVPTTFIKTAPCYVVAIKSPKTNGYASVQLGFKQVRKIAKPTKGIIEKAGVKTPLRFLREFRVDNINIKLIEEDGKKMFTVGEKKFSIGQELKPTDLFVQGKLVAVSGVSKGKGFQGVVKRHGFKGGSKTHGQSDRQRAPGAIGMTTTPGRVFKGKRMAGRMGNDRITMSGFEVVEVKEDGLRIKGLVPGSIGGLLEVRQG